LTLVVVVVDQAELTALLATVVLDLTVVGEVRLPDDLPVVGQAVVVQCV
jgi:hypothetical protein